MLIDRRYRLLELADLNLAATDDERHIGVATQIAALLEIVGDGILVSCETFDVDSHEWLAVFSDLPRVANPKIGCQLAKDGRGGRVEMFHFTPPSSLIRISAHASAAGSV